MVRYGTSLYIHVHHKCFSNSRVAYVNRTKSLKNKFNECVHSICFHTKHNFCVVLCIVCVVLCIVCVVLCIFVLFYVLFVL